MHIYNLKISHHQQELKKTRQYKIHHNSSSYWLRIDPNYSLLPNLLFKTLNSMSLTSTDDFLGNSSNFSLLVELSYSKL